MSTTNPITDIDLQKHFAKFKLRTLGNDHQVVSPYGKFPMVYADWIAEGRLYEPIENKIRELAPFIANPHSYSSYTGKNITRLYQEARQLIKLHVNASENDMLITTGHGMTGAMERFIKILKNRFQWEKLVSKNDRPVVFITHMEHHSNHTTWLQNGAEVVILPAGKEGLVDPKILSQKLKKYQNRSVKIGSFSASSNVTGIITPYYKLAEIMHEEGGICVMDFAASAPYVNMNMHPKNKNAYLDAVLFAPHKFLGGPGTCGVLVINKSLHPGFPTVSSGGNVKWTLPSGEYGVSDNLEQMEDSGTPAFIQTIRTALAIHLKEEMQVELIHKREKQLMDRAFKRLKVIPEVSIMDGEVRADRIGVVSFNIEGLHYNLVVRLLNDRFGIQTRGGWSCASNYAYHLFDYDLKGSKELTDRIKTGNMTGKPGWARLSLHPTMSNEDLDYCLEAIEKLVEHGENWAKDYQYHPADNEYYPVNSDIEEEREGNWFTC